MPGSSRTSWQRATATRTATIATSSSAWCVAYFIANQRIEIVSRVDEIVLEGADAARAVLHAGMLGQRSGAELLAGVDADLYRFELELVNDGGEWQIIGANWDRALGE